MKEQSDQGLHCLLFSLHLVDSLRHGKTMLFKGQGSIRPIFGLKISENLNLFTVIEIYSHYKDITPLCR